MLNCNINIIVKDIDLCQNYASFKTRYRAEIKLNKKEKAGEQFTILTVSIFMLFARLFTFVMSSSYYADEAYLVIIATQLKSLLAFILVTLYMYRTYLKHNFQPNIVFFYFNL